ncbi:MAG: AtpZ/AtpI family protein [Pseudomonadota bacterium]
MAEKPAAPSDTRALKERIAAARAAQNPAREGRDKFTAGSIAWRMVTELVVGVLVGGALGLGLDRLFGTMPLFLIVMGMFGFAAGIRTMIRSAEEIRRAQEAADAPEDAPK